CNARTFQNGPYATCADPGDMQETTTASLLLLRRRCLAIIKDPGHTVHYEASCDLDSQADFLIKSSGACSPKGDGPLGNSISQMDSIDITLKKYVQAFRAIRSTDMEKRRAWMEKWLHNKEYQVYQSPRDLIRWLEWARLDDCVAHYLPEDRVTALTDASERESRRILAPLLKGDYKFRHVDEYNAVDFLLQNLYPVPERMRAKRVLDFGAGYGRQMNLWSRVHNLTYVAVDAI